MRRITRKQEGRMVEKGGGETGQLIATQGSKEFVGSRKKHDQKRIISEREREPGRWLDDFSNLFHRDMESYQ